MMLVRRKACISRSPDSCGLHCQLQCKNVMLHPLIVSVSLWVTFELSQCGFGKEFSLCEH